MPLNTPSRKVRAMGAPLSRRKKFVFALAAMSIAVFAALVRAIEANDPGYRD